MLRFCGLNTPYTAYFKTLDGKIFQRYTGRKNAGASWLAEAFLRHSVIGQWEAHYGHRWFELQLERTIHLYDFGH